MMRRSVGSRVVAAMFAPWFALVMAEPASLHTCAEHSLHAGHAEHGMMQHDHGMPDESTPPAPAGPHHCTCIGGCCAAPPVSAPASSALSWLPTEGRTEQPLPSSERARRAAAAHVLPFANGPPAARA